MSTFMGRLAIAGAAAFVSVAFTTVASPAVSLADCGPGQWWDPVNNVCQGNVVQNCDNGWWDPVANTCRPPVASTPLACDNGSWWDPVANVCRPPVLPPQ